MLRRLKSLLTVLAFLALTAISLAAAVQTVRLGFPSSGEIYQREWRSWLADDDLSVADERLRRQLLLRLEHDLNHGTDWRLQTNGLTEAQKEQFQANLLLLAEAWFKQQARRFYRLNESQRDAFVDELLARVAGWQGKNRLPEGMGLMPEAGDGFGQAVALAMQFQQWLERGTPQEREQMELLVQAIQARIFSGDIRGLF